MSNRPNVLSIVLAGGEGKRLMPLTADRAKPAVPFGGTYRLIDFVLSNLANSDLTKICVLTQYKSHSLDRHVSQTWQIESMLGSYVTSVPAQQRTGKQWFLGSADAIYQSMNLPMDLFPVLFAIGRMPGWLAQWQEMLNDKEQKIARPRQIYLGADKRDYKPMVDRG